MKSRFRTQVREVINRNIVISLALEQGYNAFLPVYDGGVDFILYREKDGVVRKVQLKGRWTIDKKYVGRDIWVAFPIDSEWYLSPHDEMLVLADQLGFTLTSSWMVAGTYNVPLPSKTIREASRRYRFASLAEVAGEAAQDE